MKFRSKLTLLIIALSGGTILGWGVFSVVWIQHVFRSRLAAQPGAAADLQSFLAGTVTAGAALLVIVTALAIAASGRLARSAREMAKMAEAIRAGDLEKRLPVRGGDEFGELALSLNRMLEMLNDDISKLKKLERVRSEFLGNVSHELRTPIFAMQGMLETLLRGALEDKEVSRDFIRRALANTQRLNTLLGDLIEISRIETGEMKMSFRFFPVGDFLEQVVSEMRLAAGGRDIALELGSLSPRLEVLGDKERLKQAMVNLIENAIKYNRPHGTVEVSCEQSDGVVRLAVRDTGVGIAEEHLPRIFERFYRVDKERSREAGGTGLGLAIVKHIVEAHGSSVDVESAVGRGSTFSFALKT